MRNATLVTCSLTIAGSLLTIARADEIPPDPRSRAVQPRNIAAARVGSDYGCPKPDVAPTTAEAHDAPGQVVDVGKRIVFGP